MVQSIKRHGVDIIVYAIILLICALMLYPFLYVLAISLSAPAEVYGANITIYPKGFTLLAYKYIALLPSVLRAYENSILYTSLGTAISVVLTVLCAYPLSKTWLYGRKVLIFFVVLTMFVSGGLIPTFLVVKSIGLYNSMWALILPGALNTYLMLVTLTFFRSIPEEMVEAGYIDGASDLTVLTRIMLPLCKPILALLTLYYAVGLWNAWFPASIFLDDPAKYPIQLVLRNAMASNGFSTTEMTQAFGDTLRNGQINQTSLNYALIIAVVLPIIFIYPFLQKYFIKGAMIGSLKG